jgi:hypothetical protein
MTPEIYRRVRKARPELAVSRIDDTSEDKFYNSFGRVIPEEVAYAMILVHWLANLGEGFALMRSHTGKRFIMVHCLHLAYRTVGEYYDDPCVALAEFHVPGSTKGAKP